jgi:leucyl/phenylalanyl-tRNA--protein transferase
MFSRHTDASKVALAYLAAYLETQDFAVIDCQMTTTHLLSLGAQEMPRRDFCAGLAHWTREGPPPARWAPDAGAGLF